MGAITKLPAREEKRILDAVEVRAELRMPISERDRRIVNSIFTPEFLQRKEKEKAAAAYPAQLTKEAVHELKKLDRHQLAIVQEKMRRVMERPAEIGDEKHGPFNGQKTLKVDGTSHVLMFAFEERSRMVTFTKFGHHDTIYRSVPRIESFTPFEEWVAGC